MNEREEHGFAAARPAWLGIGAQRSGTTWLTNLLCEHPKVAISDAGDRHSRVEGKEQHQLYRGILFPWTEERSLEYKALFKHDDPSMRVGECTPFYLKAPWSANAAATMLCGGAPILAILRDPVERFESDIRAFLTGRDGKDLDLHGPNWIRTRGSDALWGGMYATQLEAWASVLGRDRLTVLQYETVRADPQSAVDGLWRQMGLQPVPLTGIKTPSSTSSSREAWSIDSVVGLRDHLRRIYRPQVERLVEWGIDPALWPNFSR